MRKAVGSLWLVLVAGSCADYADFHWAAVAAGGQGGTGGAGGAATACTPGEKRECYTGPEGTKGQGICRAGEETCLEDGSGFGACEGEVLSRPAEDCATPEDDDCDGLAPACSGTVLWAARFGDGMSQFARGVAVDPAGDAVVVGSFLGSVDFGGQAMSSWGGTFFTDMFVAKVDGSGSHVWSRSFGEDLSQTARSVAVDSDGNVIVVGDYQGSVDFGDGLRTSAGGSDMFVVKLDAGGSPVWSRSYGDPSDQFAYGVAADATGNIVITGAFNGAVDFGDVSHSSSGGTDLFLVKLDASGSVLWSRAYGGPGPESGSSVTFDDEGNVLITGSFKGTLELGETPHASAGGYDAFLAKLDAGGMPLWSRSYGDGADQTSFAVATDAGGAVIVTGSYSGAIDFGDGAHESAGGSDVFLAKLDASGAPVWSRSFGDQKDLQTGYALTVDKFGSIILAGSFNGSIDLGNGVLTSGGGADMFLAKLDSTGATLWSRRFGDVGVQVATSVAVDASDRVWMTGYLAGTVDVGSMTLTSAGAEDVVLVKLAP